MKTTDTTNGDPIELAADNWRGRGWSAAVDGMAVVTSVMRAQQLLLGEVEAALRPFDLTFARFEVLRLLAFSRRGALPMGVVGERLQVHPASATNAVNRLEADGLAERSSDPGDRRRVLVSPTAAGRARVEAATEVLNTSVFQRLPMGDDASSAVIAGLRELRQGYDHFSS